MYTLILVLCMLAVVLSPLVVDWSLSLGERRKERRALRARRRTGPHLVWASPRGR